MGKLRVSSLRVSNVFALNVLALLAIVGLLAGCGGSSNNSATVAGLTTTSTPAATSTAATTTAGTATSTTGTSTTTAGAASSSTSAKTSSTSTSTTTTTTSSSTSSAAATPSKRTPGMIAMTSSAFTRGAKIPVRYTCDGANVSPPLQWQKVPSDTVELFLFVLDLTGGPKGSIRWAVGGISPHTHSIPAGSAPPGTVVGRNSTGKVGWGGICPAKGKPHSFVFLLYGLHKKINVSTGFTPSTVQRQLSGNAASAGIMFGTYQRS